MTPPGTPGSQAPRRSLAPACCVAAVLAASLLLPPPPAHSYTLILRSGGEPLRWKTSALPIRFRIHEGTGPGLANVTDDSDPRAALARALTRWPAASSVRFESEEEDTADGGKDGKNIITFADTADNRDLFEMAGEPVGLSLFFFDGAEIREADVLFNPGKRFTTAIDSIEDLEEANLFDVEAVATHELGHAIGLDHSGVESAAMWPLASLVPRTLDPDDIAAVRVLYPDGNSVGRLSGTVRVGGDAAFGAHVVAVSERGPVISTLTKSDGSYTIENLAPGAYTAYVEPLDGPFSSQQGDPCKEFGNLSRSGPWGGRDLTTDFPTTFGSQTVEVRAGGTATVNFDLARASNPLNPVLLGKATELSLSLSAVPVEVGAGATQRIAVAGLGLNDVAESGIRFVGPGVSLVAGSLNMSSIRCNGNPTPVLSFEVAVAADAASGGRTILLSDGAETAALTGALRIRGAGMHSPTPTASAPPSAAATRTHTATPRPTTPPAACVGDCNEDGEITIDELVRGVAIALGNSRLDSCPAFDVGGDGTVTVDELVRAVNGALGGCVRS